MTKKSEKLASDIEAGLRCKSCKNLFTKDRYPYESCLFGCKMCLYCASVFKVEEFCKKCEALGGNPWRPMQ